jgi:hypothetical protein
MVGITGCLHASASRVENICTAVGRYCHYKAADVHWKMPQLACTRLRPRRHRISAGFRSRAGFGLIIGYFPDLKRKILNLM